MRNLVSKSLAGGLSAAVVLLWWPMLFASDSAGSWLARGVAWTVLFELLAHAFAPFEAALWATPRGERLRDRVLSAGSRLRSESPRRRLGWSAGMALAAVAVPAALLAAGLHEGGIAPSADKAKVVRVTRVVRPVTVKRVVRRVEAPAPAATAAAPEPAPPVPRTVALSPRTTERPKPTRKAAAAPRRPAVKRSPSKPKPAPDTVHVAPEQAPACEGDGCATESVPAAGSTVRVSAARPSADSALLG